MKRLWAAVQFDVRFQFRHGFYTVYVLVCVLYWVLLYFIPKGHKETVTMLLTFSDPSAVGLILAGGIVLLEKDQGIHASLFATPLRLQEYLLAKAISISLLSLASAWAIHGVAIGLSDNPLLFSTGVALTSSMITLLSIGVVANTQSINGFILLSQLYALPFVIPLLGLFGIVSPYLYAIIPTTGSLVLLRSAFESVSYTEIAFALLILLLGNYFVFTWARRSFSQKIFCN
ncbi:fluoroquinolone transport system permease protein [Paenibacillus phyllosphaerae]|uniref:Fluoroquinolone transport system permease protein n=1 Tax=Paenibacillus phyllosphaerae TaxID=274593 RepID=A0A7W5B5I0_9BACL|nr:ABC transporter permease [Paenibacillus phyllosphaerae]MBB3114743.1 fluoroquinolone transport system permease protein [Paenibacillus phyllosphaerae]